VRKVLGAAEEVVSIGATLDSEMVGTFVSEEDDAEETAEEPIGPWVTEEADAEDGRLDITKEDPESDGTAALLEGVTMSMEDRKELEDEDPVSEEIDTLLAGVSLETESEITSVDSTEEEDTEKLLDSGAELEGAVFEGT
jgi:hypothetical protein